MSNKEIAKDIAVIPCVSGASPATKPTKPSTAKYIGDPRQLPPIKPSTIKPAFNLIKPVSDK